MGVFTRPDSKYYWLYLERKNDKGFKERTAVLATEENRSIADRVYRERMRQIAKAEHFAPRTLQAPRGDLGGWCYIYFVSDGSKIKIGRAVNVLNRLRAMQTGHPKPLRVLATVLAHKSVEPMLHRRFRAHQITRGKEWFRAAPELTAFIERVARGRDPLAELLKDSRSVPAASTSIL